MVVPTPKAGTTKTNSMTSERIATEMEITTNVAKNMINMETVTNAKTNLEINLGTILDLATKAMTNPRIVSKVVETNEISAGNTVMYAKKEDIVGY